MSTVNQPTYVVGYTFTNVQGLKATVIAYRGRKDIDIQFEDGTIKTGTTGSYIKKGYPLHPTHGKIQVGDKFNSESGDIVEVVEYKSASKVRCKWLSDGAEKWVEATTLRLGVLRHPNPPYKVGDIVTTNKHGDVEVVEFNSATDVVVRFKNCGSQKTTNSSCLKLGTLRPDNFFDSRIGQKVLTNSGWKGEVVAWHTAYNVEVLWQDGGKTSEVWNDIVIGAIKPLNQPSVAGVGYFGEGRFVPNSYVDVPDGKEAVDSHIYNYWHRMIARCYSEAEQSRPSTKAYIGCTVAKEWHNFQNFAEWASEQRNCGKLEDNGRLYHIDKDIIAPGNRVYGPDTCVFVPNEVNTFFCKTDIGNTGYPGVNYIKPPKPNSKEGYIARCFTPGGDREYLGYYNTPQEAYKKYVVAKEAGAKRLSQRWEGKLDDRVIEALMNFKVAVYPT